MKVGQGGLEAAQVAGGHFHIQADDAHPVQTRRRQTAGELSDPVASQPHPVKGRTSLSPVPLRPGPRNSVGVSSSGSREVAGTHPHSPVRDVAKVAATQQSGGARHDQGVVTTSA